ncbi:plant-specific domain TIGR01627 family protein [Musa troglodytarum]|uniref:Plant-specific domain TIGR01627 family protein n=1 Tax=Musa troglodytarum TaxID=320322 RepID=A0A9E7KX20_9LILI|nr:plant-specific domain TIGR01627 family protein [Musa troglodytarum]
MKGVNSTRLILLQPSSNHKQGGNGVNTSISISVSHHHRIWLIGLLSFITFASLLTLLSTTTARDPSDLPSASSSTAAVASARSASYGKPSPLPAPVFDALVNYAASSNSTGKMREEDLRAVAGVLRRRAPCNLLVFGIGHETPLWRALNHGGRTVFLDENEYYCRPVQNLLFSDCRLAINDLPNQLYDVAWDVILVDGPKGHAPAAPGRMSAIFTAAVMARSRGRGHTDVLVHDHDREAERVCSAEFLCPENLVAATPHLAHFLIRAGPADEFCSNRTSTAGDAIATS